MLFSSSTLAVRAIPLGFKDSRGCGVDGTEVLVPMSHDAVRRAITLMSGASFKKDDSENLKDDVGNPY
jgi:hypothetical protein